MDKNVFSIENIFSGRLFRIPDYQRGYAWEVTHCEELMEDIELLPEKFDHYTGTLVIRPYELSDDDKLDLEGKSYVGYDVVDGQQRLTSISILLSIIKNELQRFDNFKSLSEGLEKNYIHTKRLADDGLLFKLTLNKDCKDYFKHNIIGNEPDLTGATILSHKRLFNAKKFFVEYFQAKALELKDSYNKWLLTLHNKVTQQLKLSVYVVENASDVGVIFEVMNNRGKPLTELEKVKNYLLYITSKLTITTRDDLAEKVNETWTSIFEGFMSAGLGADSENQLLRSHWLMAYDYNRREWDGSKSIKARYNLKKYQNEHLKLFNELKEYVRTLKDASIAFADAEKPDRDTAFNSFAQASEKAYVRKWSTKLKRTRTLASFRPLLLACRLKFVNDAKKYGQLVDLLEKFAFRVYNMEGKRADTGQSSLCKIAYQIFNGHISFATAIEYIKWTLNNYCPDARFQLYWNFNEADNDWYGWGPLKYFLYEYEEHLAGKGHVQFSWNYFNDKQLADTVEHILPQTPTSFYWKSRFKGKTFNILIHDLGNLCLTHNNSSYSNNDFPDKKGLPGQEKPCYSGSSLYQERSLTQFTDWDTESIKVRRELMVGWALKRWHVDLPAAGNEQELEEEIVQMDEIENMLINSDD